MLWINLQQYPKNSWKCGEVRNTLLKPNNIQFFVEQKEEIEKRKAAEAAAMKKFREDVRKKIETFLHDEQATKYEFDPMDKIQRSIV